MWPKQAHLDRGCGKIQNRRRKKKNKTCQQKPKQHRNLQNKKLFIWILLFRWTTEEIHEHLVKLMSSTWSVRSLKFGLTTMHHDVCSHSDSYIWESLKVKEVPIVFPIIAPSPLPSPPASCCLPYPCWWDSLSLHTLVLRKHVGFPKSVDIRFQF